MQDKAYAYAQAIEEYTQEGSGPKRLSATTTFADDLVSQTRYDDTGTPSTRYVQADGFGSTRLLTDENGAVTDAIDYDAFGNVIARVGSTDIDHLYRGEALDPNTGFYYLRARFYDSSNGRFLTQDSFAGFGMDPRSLHKYTYTHNDPINGMDPSGYMTLAEAGATLNTLSNLYTVASISFNVLTGNYAAAGATTLEIAEEVVLSKLSYLRPVAKLSDSVKGLFSRVWSRGVKLKLGHDRSSKVLRHNMEQLLGKAPANHQAHHIVGEAYPEGKQATNWLRDEGIDVNSVMNGVFLPGCGNKSGVGAIHCGKHNRQYEIDVRDLLEPVRGDKEAMINTLNAIREQLLAGAWRLNKH